MPLSDHEQRLLEQIEQALYAEDPKFAHHYRSTDLRTLRRSRLARVAVLFLIGGGLVGAGLWQRIMPMVVGGGSVLAAAVVLSLVVWVRFRPARRPVAATPRTRLAARRSLRHRLEDRWERRWEQRGRDF